MSAYPGQSYHKRQNESKAETKHHMKFTVEKVCELLADSKLMPPDEIKAIQQRWQAEARDSADDPVQFTRWLTAKQLVTDYQAALAARGYTDGFLIHHYTILEPLGKGNKGARYKAVHQLGQLVTIKLMPPSFSKEPHLIAAFQRDAKLAVRLKHPNVARCFHIGQFDGNHFMVMEYVPGETLDVVLQRRQKLPANEAVRLIHQALQGLQHIHEQGLVHRNISPARLLVSPSGRDDADTTQLATVKILDAGLGRVLNDNEVPDDTFTSDSSKPFDCNYLSPEQMHDPPNNDIRADIYSLGCVLYHALTGQPPFPDANPLCQMIRHNSEAPRPLAESAPGTPAALQAVLERMLAKDPAKRYSTPAQAADALKPFVVGDNVAIATDEGPKLKTYLTWLQMNMDSRGGAAPVGGPLPPPSIKPTRPAPAAVSATVLDVGPKRPDTRSQGSSLLPVSNWEWYFSGLGAGVVILAGLIGFAMAWLMRG